MTKFFRFIFWVFINFLYFIKSGRIVGNIINQNKYIDGLNSMHTFCMNEKTTKNPQCVITNKNNLIYYEKDRDLFLEENNFIKNKKLISISPGGLKGFYELGILSYIKDNYDMENYIFSGASAGSWNALFMCYKKDTKRFVYNLLDYKLSQIKNIKELEYFLKYKLLSSYNSEEFDLRRLFIGVTGIKNFKKTTNIFSDFDNLEDAINCCIASSHIPFITGGLTNRYHNMYTFDGGFSNYPYLNFTENVLHISPGMWKDLENDSPSSSKYNFFKRFSSLNIIFELISMIKNNNYMELFDHGYADAKSNKALLDKIFSTYLEKDITKGTDIATDDIIVKYDGKIHQYPNSHLELNKDNDSY
jgi:hypothetical protein